MFSPLEQFLVLNLFSFYGDLIDFSVTNNSVMILIAMAIFFLMSKSLYTFGKFVISNKWQLLFEEVYVTCVELVYDILGLKGEMFFPVIFSTFLIILVLNILGLIPYSFTVTSHLACTLIFSYMIFIGVVAVGIYYHGFNFVTLFLPAGTSLALSFLLIPVEILSYFFKPVSLGVRLFANLMAGHTLLTIAGGGEGGGAYSFVACLISTSLDLAFLLVIFTELTRRYISHDANLLFCCFSSPRYDITMLLP